MTAPFRKVLVLLALLIAAVAPFIGQPYALAVAVILLAVALV
ncbi:MAG: hypothetical protein ABI970_12500 [Chloroflexota bacterium]